MPKTRENLLAIDWDSEELPTLPSIAYRLLDMVTSDESDVSELSDMISKDPTLTLKVLQAANSAFFAISMEVTSIKHAIVLLGMKEIRQIVLGTILAKRFLTVAPEVRPHARLLWQHLLTTAVLAQDLSRGVGQEPDLYTLGLLHDIGWLVLMDQAPRVFMSLAEERDMTRAEAESSWGVDHQLWGSKLAERWGLPEPFQIVALRHHSPLMEHDPPDYLIAITLANHLSNFMGIRMLNTPLEDMEDGVLKRLSLDRETLCEMEKAIIKDRVRIETLCRILGP